MKPSPPPDFVRRPQNRRLVAALAAAFFGLLVSACGGRKEYSAGFEDFPPESAANSIANACSSQKLKSENVFGALQMTDPHIYRSFWYRDYKTVCEHLTKVHEDASGTRLMRELQTSCPSCWDDFEDCLDKKITQRFPIDRPGGDSCVPASASTDTAAQ